MAKILPFEKKVEKKNVVECATSILKASSMQVDAVIRSASVHARPWWVAQQLYEGINNGSEVIRFKVWLPMRTDSTQDQSGAQMKGNELLS